MSDGSFLQWPFFNDEHRRSPRALMSGRPPPADAHGGRAP